MTGLAGRRLVSYVPGLIARGGRGTVAAVIRAPLCCLLALGLTCSSVVQAQESTPVVPAATDGPALYDQGKYVEAARAFEKEETDKGLYNAGMARHAAFHEALASDRWRRYLEQAEVSEVDRADLKRRIAGAQGGLVKVRFTADAVPVSRSLVLEREGNADDAWTVPWPAGHATVEVALDVVDWRARLSGGVEEAKFAQVAVRKGEVVTVSFASAAVASPVVLRLGPPRALRRGVTVTWSGPTAAPPEQQVRTAEARWDLAPGAWQLQVVTPHFESVKQTVEVRAAEPASVALTLKRSGEDRLRIGLAAGLGVAAGGLLVGGLVGVVGGNQNYRDAVSLLDSTMREVNEPATADALAAIQRGSNGMIVATTAAGTGIAAITVAAGGGDKVLAAETGVGGVLIIAGVAWLVVAKRQYEADVPPGGGAWVPDKGYLDERRRPELAAAGLLGVGTGLAAGALVALVARTLFARHGRRKVATVTPMTTPRGVGFAVQGTF